MRLGFWRFEALGVVAAFIQALQIRRNLQQLFVLASSTANQKGDIWNGESQGPE